MEKGGKMNAEQRKEVDERIIEKLADIEHQRWSGWQSYLHSKCQVCPNGDLLIPAGYVEHLEKQIKTPYKLLSYQEQESDRAEVMKYIDIIYSEIERLEKEWALSYPTGRENERKQNKLEGARELAEKEFKIMEDRWHKLIYKSDIEQALAEMENSK
jgi:hypothetical protein